MELYSQSLGPASVAVVGSPTICSCYPRHHYGDGRGTFFGMLAALIFILLLAALLAGLILGLTGLDITWLNVMSTTGPEKRRKQAQTVARIKRQGTWFLCSMLLISVLCIEVVPVLTLSLFGDTWLPILLSFLGIFIFIELLPQFLIPRQPLYWGYYCRYLIWVCLLTTVLITYPLSWVLDRCTIPKHEKGIYDNEQLAQLVKYHERKEKHGGNLGPDAGRIMRGAIELDGRTMEKAYSRRSLDNGISKLDGVDDNIDLEMSIVKDNHSAIKSEIIVPWTAVKYILIGEEVNEAFMLKIKVWGYSRLPVVGNADGRDDSAIMGNAWNGNKVFGFLHIKNLLGVDTTSITRNRLLVRDLQLYPLPIVRDDLPIYDLLNMFQLGPARMAIIINAPARDSKDWLATHLATTAIKRPHHSTPSNPLWHVNRGLSHGSEAEVGVKVDWTTDFIEAAKVGVARNLSEHPGGLKMDAIIGIGCPEPLGIITFEDVIDAVMQKTSCDETDFFDRKGKFPATKRRKEGDFESVRSSMKIYRSRSPGACRAQAYKPPHTSSLDRTSPKLSPGTKVFRYAPFPTTQGGLYPDGMPNDHRRDQFKKPSKAPNTEDDQSTQPGPGFIYGDGEDAVPQQTPRLVEVPKMGLYQSKTGVNWADDDDENVAMAYMSLKAQDEVSHAGPGPDSAIPNNTTLRRRTKSGQHSQGLDGTEGVRPGGVFGMDGHRDDDLSIRGRRYGMADGVPCTAVHSASEYTTNSQGGFHGEDESAEFELSITARMYEVPKYSREVFPSLEEVQMASEADIADMDVKEVADFQTVTDVQTSADDSSSTPMASEADIADVDVQTVTNVQTVTDELPTTPIRERETTRPMWRHPGKVRVGDVLVSPTNSTRVSPASSNSSSGESVRSVEGSAKKNSSRMLVPTTKLIEKGGIDNRFGWSAKKRTPTHSMNGVRVTGSRTSSSAGSESGEGSDKENKNSGPLVMPKTGTETLTLTLTERTQASLASVSRPKTRKGKGSPISWGA